MGPHLDEQPSSETNDVVSPPRRGLLIAGAIAVVVVLGMIVASLGGGRNVGSDAVAESTTTSDAPATSPAASDPESTTTTAPSTEPADTTTSSQPQLLPSPIEWRQVPLHGGLTDTTPPPEGFGGWADVTTSSGDAIYFTRRSANADPELYRFEGTGTPARLATPPGMFLLDLDAEGDRVIALVTNRHDPFVYPRDCGEEPQHMFVAVSTDRGETWQTQQVPLPPLPPGDALYDYVFGSLATNGQVDVVVTQTNIEVDIECIIDGLDLDYAGRSGSMVLVTDGEGNFTELGPDELGLTETEVQLLEERNRTVFDAWVVGDEWRRIDAELSQVNWTDGRFAAPAGFSTVMTSNDGFVWLERTVGTGSFVFTSGGAFVEERIDSTRYSMDGGFMWFDQILPDSWHLVDAATVGGIRTLTIATESAPGLAVAHKDAGAWYVSDPTDAGNNAYLAYQYLGALDSAVVMLGSSSNGDVLLVGSFPSEGLED